MDDGAGPDPGQRDHPDAAEPSGCDPNASDRASHGSPDLHQVARDWIDLWESELSALAIDREAREAWHALMPLWTGASLLGAAWNGAIAAALRTAMDTAAGGGPRDGFMDGVLRASARPGRSGPARDEPADRRTRAKSTARAATAAPAPDARDDEIERLTRHVAELEARLAALERDRGGAAGGRRKRKG